MIALLTFDEAEAAHFDATGRDDDPRFPVPPLRPSEGTLNPQL